MQEPIWVLNETVRQIHQLQLQAHGGDQGIRDENLLASALHRYNPMLNYKVDEMGLCYLGAAYAFSIVRNR